MVIVATTLETETSSSIISFPSAVSGTIYFADRNTATSENVIRSYTPSTLDDNVASGVVITTMLAMSPVFNKTQVAMIIESPTNIYGDLYTYNPTTKVWTNRGTPDTLEMSYSPSYPVISSIPSLNSNNIFVYGTLVE